MNLLLKPCKIPKQSTNDTSRLDVTKGRGVNAKLCPKRESKAVDLGSGFELSGVGLKT